MTWEVRAQRSTRDACVNSEELGWSAVLVETQAEAEAWWTCRTTQRHTTRVVHTMLNPAGEVVRVLMQ
jgi:hypothetical protein